MADVAELTKGGSIATTMLLSRQRDYIFQTAPKNLDALSTYESTDITLTVPVDVQRDEVSYVMINHPATWREEEGDLRVRIEDSVIDIALMYSGELQGLQAAQVGIAAPRPIYMLKTPIESMRLYRNSSDEWSVAASERMVDHAGTLDMFVDLVADFGLRRAIKNTSR